jgi:AraC family transcriptional regulator
VPSSEILLHDLSGVPVRLADERSVAVSSAGAGWAGLAVERQCLPAVADAEGYMPWHLLSVQLSPPPQLREHRDGRVDIVRLGPGDVLFRPAGIPTRASWTGPSDVINVAVEPEAVGAMSEESRFGPDPVVRHVASALIELAAASAVEPLVIDGIRIALGGHIATRYARAAPPAAPRRLTTAELSRVRERIDAGLADELRLADLAAAIPLSPYHFSRVFKASTGLTPHAYVMRCRTDAARSLLAKGNLGIDEIARRTGFADGPHLARRFRRRFGLSPVQFRAAARRT